MKRINILTAILLLALSVSCSRKETFEHTTFLSLYGDKINVKENVKDGQLKIPVTLYNPTGAEVQVSIKLTDGKAKQGVDYELVSPALGVLTFANDVDSLDIVFDITNYPDELTGSKDFTIEITSPNVAIGDISKTVVTIKDADHPLDEIFLGDWMGVAIFADEAGSQMPMTISILPDEDDPTYKGVYIYNLDPLFALNGISSDVDMNIFKASANDDNTQLIIRSYQQSGERNDIGTAYISGSPSAEMVNPGSADKDIIITRNPNGTLTITNGFGSLNNEGWLSFYYGGITLVPAQ